MKYVVIGSSAAGINAIRELRKQDKEGQIVLVSKDQDIYSRCILHHYLCYYELRIIQTMPKKILCRSFG